MTLPSSRPPARGASFALAAWTARLRGGRASPGWERSGGQACATPSPAARCRALVSANADYRTPNGALATAVKCSSAATMLTAPLVIKWVLSYKSPSVASYQPR